MLRTRTQFENGTINNGCLGGLPKTWSILYVRIGVDWSSWRSGAATEHIATQATKVGPMQAITCARALHYPKAPSHRDDLEAKASEDREEKAQPTTADPKL